MEPRQLATRPSLAVLDTFLPAWNWHHVIFARLVRTNRGIHVPGTARVELGFIRSQELLEELKRDIDTAYQTLGRDKKSQYLRRCVVRAIFSYIEAILESVKVELRSTVRTGLHTGSLTDKELEVLGPLHVIGAEPGKFLPLDANVKRTFRLAVKIWKLSNFKLTTGGEDFRDFLAAKNARNRLTHPRTFYDIEVNDHDMQCHTIAGMWIQAELKRLFEALIHALAEGLPATDRAEFIKKFAS